MSADVPLVAAQPDPLVGGTNANGGSSLKKEFTVLSGVGFIAGNIIGSGIFITPRKIFVNTGSFGLTLVAWVIGGLIALAGGLCYIELGVVIRKSGGEYPIIRTVYSFNNKCERFGKVLAFLFLWTSVLVLRTVGAAIVLLTCAHYLSQPFYIGSQAPQSLITVLALGVLGEYTHTPQSLITVLALGVLGEYTHTPKSLITVLALGVLGEYHSPSIRGVR